MRLGSRRSLAALLLAGLCACEATPVRPIRCTRDADCRAGEACDPGTGACKQVAAVPPARLALRGQNAVIIGRCAAYSAATLDEAGAPANAAADTRVALSGNTGGAFYQDPECAHPADAFTIPAGRGVALLYFSAPVPERFVMRAEASGLSPASLAVAVIALAGPPNRLLVAGPDAIAPGACAAYTVTAADEEENASVVAADLPVDLSGNGFGAFYSDPACAAEATRVPLAGGESSATFWFKDASPEGVIITADAARLGRGILPVAVAVSAGSADHMVLAGPRVISQAACAAYTATGADSAGRPAPAAAQTMVALAGSSGGTFHKDPACATPAAAVPIAAGASAATFYFRDFTPETPVLDAAATELAPAHLRLIVLAVGAYPTRLALSGPASLRAGSCGAYRVASADGAGDEIRVLADTVVGLTAAGAGKFFADGDCTAEIAGVLIPSRKTAAAFYFRDDVSEQTTLTASDSGPAQLASATLPVDVEVGLPARLALAGPATVSAGLCAAFTVTAIDAQGERSSVSADLDVSISTDGETDARAFIDAECLYAAAGVVIVKESASQTFYFRDPSVESVVVRADAQAVAGDALDVEVVAGPPAALALAGPPSVVAGACSGAYLLATLDALGNAAKLASHTSFDLEGGGSGAFHSDDHCATAVTIAVIAAGTGEQRFYFRGPVAQHLTFTAHDPGEAIFAASLAVEVTAAPIAGFTVTQETHVAGEEGAVTVVFTTANTWPADGIVTLVFPDGYDLSGAALDSASADGSYTVSVSGQTVTLTRSGGSDVAAGTEVTLVLDGIVNPGVSGQAGATTVTTSTHDGDPIDAGTSGGGAPIDPAPLGATGVTLSNPSFDATGIATVEFTTANPWPADGSVSVTFPDGFDVSAAAFASAAGADGAFTVSISGQTVTLTRSGGSEVPAGTAVSIQLANIRNPGTTGATGDFAVATLASGGQVIDEGVAPSSFIQPGALNASITLYGPSTAGSSGNVGVGIFTSHLWPAGGQLVVVFPPGFDLSGVNFTDTGSAGLTFDVAVSGQTVTLTRTNMNAFAGGLGMTIVVGTVKNPAAAGTTGTFEVSTRTPGGSVIDIGTAPGVTITAASGALGATSVLLANPNAGASGQVYVDFTTERPWPADGKLEIVFPAGFDVAGATFASASGVDGGFTVTKSGQTVTLTRSGGAAAGAGAAIRIVLGNVTNPTTAGATAAYALATRTAGGAPIDTGTAAGSTIQPVPVRVDFPTSAARHVVAADFNGDGLLDLAFASHGPKMFSVVINQHTLGQPFTAASLGGYISFQVNDANMVVASGDLNMDGRPDVVVANQSGGDGVSTLGKLSVFANVHALGTAFGASSFAPRFDLDRPGNTHCVIIADLNGDGRPDLAATGPTNNVSVYINQHTPGAALAASSFAARVDFATPGFSTYLAAGDLTGDGRPDLVVANAISNNISVLANQHAPGAAFGASSFAARVDFAGGHSVGTVALGDVNGDGKLDVATSNAEPFVSVFINQHAPGAAFGAASLRAPLDLDTGVNSSPLKVAFADLNLDGRPDLLVGYYQTQYASVFENRHVPGAAFGASSFAPRRDYPTWSSPMGVAAADMDGDGRPDLLIASRDSSYSSVIPNRDFVGRALDAASWAAPIAFATAEYPFAVEVRDFDGDGRPDVAALAETGRSLSVFVNQHVPGQAFGASGLAGTAFATHYDARGLVVEDFNGDGRPDIAHGNASGASSSLAVFRNQHALGTAFGSSSLAGYVEAAVNDNPYRLASGDLNGDGKRDVVSIGYTVAVILNQHTLGQPLAPSSFAAPFTVAAGSAPNAMAVGDLSGDGRPDLVVANWDSSAPTLSVLVNQHAPGGIFDASAFAARVTYASATSPAAVLLADLNGDGRPEMIAVEPGGGGGGTLSVWANQHTAGQPMGPSSFGARIDLDGGFLPQGVAAADVNGDGKPDLVAADTAGGVVRVYRNQHAPGAPLAASSFAAPLAYPTGNWPHSVAVRDLTGDGKPDFVVGRGDTAISVLVAQ